MDKITLINDQVHRVIGPWTKQVHKLLNYLHQEGFTFVPKPLGFDEQGREIVSFLRGETSNYPWSKNAASQNALVSAAKLLRAYHDISQHFLKHELKQQGWMLPAKNPQEVICHGDFAPYNIVFDNEQAIGIIDFDTAHPGPRKWDIAYSLYRFAPFMHKGKLVGTIEDQILRASLFCDAYGLLKEDRRGLANLMIERLTSLIKFMLKSANEGNQQFKLNIKAGHHLTYLEDIEYIKTNRSYIEIIL